MGILSVLAAGIFLWSIPDDVPAVEAVPSDDGLQKIAEQGKDRQKTVAKKENPVLVVRGAKLAASDKNPTNPFSMEHLTEAQEKERGIGAKVRDKPGLAGKGPVKANNSEAMKDVSAGKEHVQRSEGNVVENASSADNVKLVGILQTGDSSIAIISSNGRQISLAVGEEDNGVTLQSIAHDSVQVRFSSGQIINLKM